MGVPAVVAGHALTRGATLPATARESGAFEMTLALLALIGSTVRGGSRAAGALSRPGPASQR
jgi:hypothetical protein